MQLNAAKDFILSLKNMFKNNTCPLLPPNLKTTSVKELLGAMEEEEEGERS